MVEKLFRSLKGWLSRERFQVRMLIMNLISQLIGSQKVWLL